MCFVTNKQKACGGFMVTTQPDKKIKCVVIAFPHTGRMTKETLHVFQLIRLATYEMNSWQDNCIVRSI